MVVPLTMAGDKEQRFTMAHEDDRYALARIDLPGVGTHGWQVRLQRQGKRYAKYFADNNWGGSRASYHAARQWRDGLLKRLDEAEQIRVCRPSSRNQSGVVGVSRVSVSSNGTVYEFWQATWSPAPGRRRTVKFSIRRYGDRKAFRLAVSAREEGVGNSGKE
ncbi:MAG: hypothetical protein PVJ98_06350 [Akkermansiaceae bacterium]